MNSDPIPLSTKPASRVRVMGILNVTPDSFSDGGRFTSPDAIARQADALVEAGADIIDIGGESTRPFAEPVSLELELARVLPAVEIVRRKHALPISIDTTKAEVARRAIEAGADIINDISALRLDLEMAGVARKYKAPVILMHMRGTPQDMQVKPAYADVVAEIAAFLAARIRWAEEQGLARERLIIDPGLGFGKTAAHNLAILKHLPELKKLGCPILVGHSRKSFIGKVLGLEAEERDTATAALSALCVLLGASILRVHDVAQTVRAARLAEAVLAAP